MKFRYIVLSLFISQLGLSQHIESFGVFGGFNVPFTLDQGMKKDLRFHERFTIRGTPIGFTYGYDNIGHGFVITPQFVQIGQKFVIQNTTGGEVGIRDIKMNFISLPIALKIHLNDLAFFRLSVVAAINLQYLIKGEETMTHSASKLKYPANVRIPTETGYSQAYDGVYVPTIDKKVYVTNDKFKSFQVFAGVGLRADVDLNEDWSLNFDGRANFGFFDPRKSDYITQLKQPVDAPDVYGQRRDVYLSASIGFARIVQIKEHHKSKSSKGRSGPKKKRY
jgi:Outer membrane protein beta-barrel domain